MLIVGNAVRAASSQTPERSGFRLDVDGSRWGRSLQEVADRLPGLVPVIKGNGYGFGAALLADRCAELGVSTVAVGVAAEVAAVRSGFDGEVLVMAPLRLAELEDGALELSGPTLRTVAQVEVLNRLAEMADPPRVVLELDSPVHRHGIRPAELPGIAGALAKVPLAGVAMHLPSTSNRRMAMDSVRRAVAGLRAAGLNPETLWVSHLDAPEIARLNELEPGIAIRPRVGTGLWLADRAAFSASGTVLDTHPVHRRESVGYRQRRSGAGTLVVVSGGTAHGVGLRAGAARGRWRDLVRAAAAGAAHGAGLSASPFHWGGRRLRFADVAHMQVSMLLVPVGTPAPAIGDRLRCDVRMTTTTFDEIVLSPTTAGYSTPALPIGGLRSPEPGEGAVRFVGS